MDVAPSFREKEPHMKNMGMSESRLRIKLSLLMLAQTWFAPGWMKWVFFMLAAFLSSTALSRFCPLWRWLRIDTREIHTIDVLSISPKQKH